jgi:hypothetical protein
MPASTHKSDLTVGWSSPPRCARRSDSPKDQYCRLGQRCRLILETRQNIARRLEEPSPALDRDLSAELRAERQAEAALEKAKALGDEVAIARARKAIADIGRHR